MWLWILSPFLVIILLIAVLIVKNTVACRRLHNKYKAVSTLMPLYFTGLNKKLEESLDKYGDSIEFFVKERKPGQKFLITNLGLFTYVIFYDWQLAREYLQRHNEFVKEKRLMFGEYYFTKNLVSQEGEQWRRQKKILSHAMTFDFFGEIVPRIAKLVEDMIAEIKPDAPLKISESCFKVGTETVGYAFFSKDLNAYTVKGKKIIYLIKESINYALMRTLLPSFVLRKIFIPLPSVKWGFFLTKDEKECLHNFEAAKAIVLEQINQRMEEIKRGEIKHSDFLTYYIQQYLSPENQKSKEICMEEILQQFDSLISAGSDTTTSLATSCVYALAKYPEEYAKLEALCAPLPKVPSPEELAKLTPLSNFIKEVSRFYPPSSDIFPRSCSKPVKIGDYEFDSGTLFGVGIKPIMNDPEVFINPTEFNPDRWNSPSINSFSYLTFSGGPRSCIGERLAMFEIMLILIGFIRKFRLDLNPQVPMRMRLWTINSCVDDRLVIPRLKQ